jgi:hypothetical protein
VLWTDLRMLEVMTLWVSELVCYEVAVADGI